MDITGKQSRSSKMVSSFHGNYKTLGTEYIGTSYIRTYST